MRKLTKPQIIRFQKFIWDYYHEHGRSMPWRGNVGAYKVLVSEIMLQQTQVSRVREKYTEFLKAFPTIEYLAKAPLGDVLKVWQGLGYNRRARFLHQLAKEVVLKHTGKIPSDYEALLVLPGIGKGTAGSVLAFAYDMPVAFIETNIRRVFIHHFFSDKEIISDKEILPIVEITLPNAHVREWYYALMDYGAYLKILSVNPNRKSKHYTKQSPFEGSNREVRGKILKVLAKDDSQTIIKLQKTLGFSKKRFDTALQALIKEGFVMKKGNKITLA